MVCLLEKFRRLEISKNNKYNDINYIILNMIYIIKNTICQIICFKFLQELSYFKWITNLKI